MTTQPIDSPGKTEKFERKRLEIINAAASIINDAGARGMTFLDVANSVGLTTTSITYYFKKKDLLAEAAFEQSLQRIEDQIDRAAECGTPREKVAHFLRSELDEWARRRAGESRRTAQLSEIRTLDDPVRTRLGRHFVDIFRKLRLFFGEEGNAADKARNIVSAHFVMENVFWLPTWLTHFSNWEFDRVHACMMDIFEHGLAGPGRDWNPHPIEEQSLAETAESDGVETFLRAATGLVNELGYRGASVNRIASELDLTKGSFYHYLTSKDDLIVKCFERSYQRVSNLQRQALAIDAPMLDRFATQLTKLLQIQFEGEFPLLRFSTLHALPPESGRDVQIRANRVAQRHAAMLSDGIVDGSVRPLDVHIASRMIGVATNSAVELRKWAVRDHPQVPALYGQALAHGIFR